LQRVETSFAPLPFDDAAAHAFGRVPSSLRRSGRQVRPRAFDALIAATAISQGLAVYTCNPTDFVGVDDLDVVALTYPADG
jgi:tRNA(fMet)-specific endonuclease VapC